MQKFEHGGDIKAVLREKQANKADTIMDFSANINPYGLPASIKNAVFSGFGQYCSLSAAERAGFTRQNRRSLQYRQR